MAHYWCPIEAGDFWFGDESKKQKLKKIRLPYGFQIARYPLTNADYACFIEAKGYEEKQWWTEQGWKVRERQNRTAPRYWNYSDLNNPMQPVVAISWYEAVAYCCWLTAQGQEQGWLPQGEVIRLPTSLEWERAARHTDQWPYSWGNEKPTPEHANYKDTGIGTPSPVGCFPQGKATCGALDMVGNVWEWTATSDDQDTEPQPQNDFATYDGIRLRGGAFYLKSELLFCGSRYWIDANSGDVVGGVRLLRSLYPSEQ
jgi:formylglycine-generating enzyme required for sulfatase activity